MEIEKKMKCSRCIKDLIDFAMNLSYIGLESDEYMIPVDIEMTNKYYEKLSSCLSDDTKKLIGETINKLRNLALERKTMDIINTLVNLRDKIEQKAIKDVANVCVIGKVE